MTDSRSITKTPTEGGLPVDKLTEGQKGPKGAVMAFPVRAIKCSEFSSLQASGTKATRNVSDAIKKNN